MTVYEKLEKAVIEKYGVVGMKWGQRKERGGRSKEKKIPSGTNASGAHAALSSVGAKYYGSHSYGKKSLTHDYHIEFDKVKEAKSALASQLKGDGFTNIKRFSPDSGNRMSGVGAVDKDGVNHVFNLHGPDSSDELGGMKREALLGQKTI